MNILNFFKKNNSKSKKQAKNNAHKIVSWAIGRSKQACPEIFNTPSINKEQRTQKFEVISIFMAMAVWYLNNNDEEDSINSDITQESCNHLFDSFEISLREQGISDIKLAKEVRTLAVIFQNRLKSYTKIFNEHDTSGMVKSIEKLGILSPQEKMSFAISCIAECKTFKDTKLNDWIIHIQEPLPSKYEPHIENSA